MSYQLLIVENDGPFMLHTTDSENHPVKFSIWGDDGMFELELKSKGKFRIKIRFQYSLIPFDSEVQVKDILLEKYIVREQVLSKNEKLSIPICWNWHKGYFDGDDNDNDEDYGELEGVVRQIEVMELIKL